MCCLLLPIITNSPMLFLKSVSIHVQTIKQNLHSHSLVIIDSIVSIYISTIYLMLNIRRSLGFICFEWTNEYQWSALILVSFLCEQCLTILKKRIKSFKTNTKYKLWKFMILLLWWVWLTYETSEVCLMNVFKPRRTSLESHGYLFMLVDDITWERQHRKISDCDSFHFLLSA